MWQQGPTTCQLSCPCCPQTYFHSQQKTPIFNVHPKSYPRYSLLLWQPSNTLDHCLHQSSTYGHKPSMPLHPWGSSHSDTTTHFSRSFCNSQTILYPSSTRGKVRKTGCASGRGYIIWPNKMNRDSKDGRIQSCWIRRVLKDSGFRGGPKVQDQAHIVSPWWQSP